MAAALNNPFRGNDAIVKVLAAQQVAIPPSRDVRKGWAANEAGSSIPKAFRDIIGEDAGIINFKQFIVECKEKNIVVDAEILEFLYLNAIEPMLMELTQEVTDKQMQEIIEDIKDNAEKKLQIFFTQLLLVAKTNRVYALHDTKDQIGQGRKLYPAAHCSVVPSLKYQSPSGDWIDLAQGTTLRSVFNITTVLPKPVNDVDGCIDGKNKSNAKQTKLRHFALEILNLVASSNNPNFKESFLSFITHFINGSRTTFDYYVAKKKSAQWVTTQCYFAVATSYQEQLAKSDSLLKRMCFVGNTDNKTLVECIESSTVKTDFQTELDFQSVQNKQQIAQQAIPPKPSPRITRSSKKLKNLLAETTQQQCKSAAAVFTKLNSTPPKSSRPKRIVKVVSVSAKLEELHKQGKIYKNYCKDLEPIKKLAKEFISTGRSSAVKEKLTQKVKASVVEKYKKNPKHASLIAEHILKELSAG